MRIESDRQGDITLSEVYEVIKLETEDGEILSICMRDSGFEISYDGVWYEAKCYNGIKVLRAADAST